MPTYRRILRLALLLFLLLAAVAAAAEEVRETVLSNGLKVLTKEVNAAPVVSAYVWYKVGSRNEVTGITGITHYVEHMLFKGSREFPKDKLKKVIETNGGTWNGFTSYDYTAYYETLPSDKLELALQIEADRMVDSLMNKDEFEAERSVIISEREGKENNPTSLLQEAVNATAFMAHSYGNPIIGWKSDIEAISHEQLTDYYISYYAPNNATLVIVGSFETDRALELVKKHFGEIPPGKPMPEVVTVEPEQRGLRRVKVTREGSARYIMGAYHIPAVDHPDRYALDVLEVVMSSGRTSRLYRSLVDKQLAGAAYFWASDAKDPTLAGFFIQVRDGVDPSEAEKAFLEEIEAVKTEPISDAELNRAVAKAEAEFIYQQDSVSRQAHTIGYYETIFSYKYLDTYLDNLRKVTKDDVLRVAKTYLNADNLTIGEFVPTSPSSSDTGRSTSPDNSVQHSESSRDSIAPGVQESKETGKTATERALPTRRILSNGLVLIVQENHSVPIVEMRAVVRAGSVFDTDETAGLADFTASMLNKGTNKRSWQEISELTESVGATVSASGGMEQSGISAKMLAKDFPQITEIVADILTNPAFPVEEIDKHRSQLYTAFKAWEDDPQQIAEEKLFEVLYPEGHSFRRRLQGYQETISGFGREDLLAFYRKHYRPDVAYLVIVGDVTADQAAAEVEKALGRWKAEGIAPTPTIPDVPLRPARTTAVTMPDKSQVEIRMGHPALKRTDPDYYATYLMNTVLGGSSGVGRLFADVRDNQGLAYGVWSYFDANLHGGTFLAGAGVNPANVDKAVSAIKANIEKISSEGITEQELSEAKSRNIGQFALMTETNAGIASVLSQVEFFGLSLDYPQKRADILRAVTVEEANAAAKKYLHPDSLSVVAAGPYEANWQR